MLLKTWLKECKLGEVKHTWILFQKCYICVAYCTEKKIFSLCLLMHFNIPTKYVLISRKKSSSLLFFLLFSKSSGVINTFFVGILIERQARYTIWKALCWSLQYTSQGIVYTSQVFSIPVYNYIRNIYRYLLEIWFITLWNLNSIYIKVQPWQEYYFLYIYALLKCHRCLLRSIYLGYNAIKTQLLTYWRFGLAIDQDYD